MKKKLFVSLIFDGHLEFFCLGSHLQFGCSKCIRIVVRAGYSIYIIKAGKALYVGLGSVWEPAFVAQGATYLL